jgi:hypothetical protein
MSRKTRKSVLRNEAGKERALIGHWNRVRKECGVPKGVEVTHAYGSAKVAATGKGNLSVPTTKTYRIAQQTFPKTILADEWRTSQVCDVTKKDMAQVTVCRTNLEDVVRDVKRSNKGATEETLGNTVIRCETALWVIHGHDHMSHEERDEKRRNEEKIRKGYIIVRTLRGLLTCVTGNGEYRDRDTMAAINIGRLYLCDIRGEKRHPAFDRCVHHISKRERKANAVHKQIQ